MPSEFKQSFQAELLRPDDLLQLHVDGSNLQIVRQGDRVEVLTVADRTQPAYLRFTLAPQTIAESAFFEAAVVPSTTTTGCARGYSKPDRSRSNDDHRRTVGSAGHAFAERDERPSA
ncbi:MAG: hypothetical protein NVS2B17_17900 [Candidatus Velthaea sp.]